MLVPKALQSVEVDILRIYWTISTIYFLPHVYFLPPVSSPFLNPQSMNHKNIILHYREISIVYNLYLKLWRIALLRSSPLFVTCLLFVCFKRDFWSLGKTSVFVIQQIIYIARHYIFSYLRAAINLFSVSSDSEERDRRQTDTRTRFL